MTDIVWTFLARFRQPRHIGWGADYTRALIFTPLWEPSIRGEIR